MLLQYQNVTRLISWVDKTLKRVCLRCSTDDEVQLILRQVIGSLWSEGIRVRKWFKVDYLRALQGSLNAMR